MTEEWIQWKRFSHRRHKIIIDNRPLVSYIHPSIQFALHPSIMVPIETESSFKKSIYLLLALLHVAPPTKLPLTLPFNFLQVHLMITIYPSNGGRYINLIFETHTVFFPFPRPCSLLMAFRMKIPFTTMHGHYSYLFAHLTYVFKNTLWYMGHDLISEEPGKNK